MGKKIEVPEIYETINRNLKVGVRQNQIYLKREQNWHPMLQCEFAIEIRRLYPEADRKKISSGAIKEVIERLLQEPSLQLQFMEETEKRYVKLLDSIFDVETGKIIPKMDKDFGYFLNFSYIESDKRRGHMQNFDKYISSVFPEDTKAKKQFMLEILGYVLSDYTIAKAGFFFIGESNSGKSTILELIQRILPEHAVTNLSLDMLGNRFNLARLADSRVNICTELNKNSFAATDVFKMLTSNEKITAEHKGCKPFEFRMRCKSLNAGNIIPDIKEEEGMGAMLNRMIILLFPIGISRSEQDNSLIEKLFEERDCIFSSALDALVDLRKRDFVFREPRDTQKIKRQMRLQEHALDSFLSYCCIMEKEAKEHLVTMYESFSDYCKNNALELRYTATQFSQYLCQKPEIEHGKFRIDGSKPLSGMKGIRLKSDAEYNTRKIPIHIPKD